MVAVGAGWLSAEAYRAADCQVGAHEQGDGGFGPGGGFQLLMQPEVLLVGGHPGRDRVGPADQPKPGRGLAVIRSGSSPQSQHMISYTSV